MVSGPLLPPGFLNLHHLSLTVFFTFRFPMLIEEYRYTHRNINLGESSYSSEQSSQAAYHTHCGVEEVLAPCLAMVDSKEPHRPALL
jgi:hypothetical protein